MLLLLLCYVTLLVMDFRFWYVWREKRSTSEEDRREKYCVLASSSVCACMRACVYIYERVPMCAYVWAHIYVCPCMYVSNCLRCHQEQHESSLVDSKSISTEWKLYSARFTMNAGLQIINAVVFLLEYMNISEVICPYTAMFFWLVELLLHFSFFFSYYTCTVFSRAF